MAKEARTAARTWARRGIRTLGVTASLCALALGIMMLVPAVLGLERYVITGGSMEGSIGRGSIAYERVVPTDELRVGDVITYDPPPAAPVDGRVTHRIVSVERDASGERVYRTKGDANASADPWTFKLPRAEQARVLFHVPFAGYALALLAIREARMVLIGLPALLLAVAVVAGLFRDVRDPNAAWVREGGTP